MLTQPLAIIDVETTGTHPQWDRVTEISILRVEDSIIVKELTTLVNPNRSIPSFIQGMTGISQKMVDDAPEFENLAREIMSLINGAILVGHNVSFDYGFLKWELKRQGYQYQSKTLCTVRLSRILFPNERRHNLDSLIQRHNLICEERHRAYHDAFALYQFLFTSLSKTKKPLLDNAIKKAMGALYKEDERFSQIIDDLPESPGVYLLYGSGETPLYIGKSINIKERVKSHFTDSYEHQQEAQMIKQLSRIEYIKTAGELGALLMESNLVKQYQPIYNRKLQKVKKFLALVKIQDKHGYDTLELTVINDFQDINFEHVFGIIKSKRAAQSTLQELSRKYSLCNKILGLEKAKGPCFEYKLGRCRGACIGKDDAKSYNRRFLIAYLENKQFKPWSYNGAIEIVEKSDEEELYESFIIDKWCIAGMPFDLDSYKILSSYLKHKKPKILSYA